MIKLNPEYTGKTLWNPSKPEAKGVFARIWFGNKLIEYYPRWWLAPAWPLIFPFIRKHERGHSWGIKECLSGSKTCIMYEDDDSWASKLKLWPNQLVGFGRFCSKCKRYLNDQGAL